MAKAAPMPSLTADQQDLFWKKIVKADGCWFPSLSPNPKNGYCQVGLKVDGVNRLFRAHRLAWLFTHGTWPEILDHLCRNRACCNPAHLEPVTARENVLRGIGKTAINAKLTHCRREGHPLEGDNLIVSRGWRICRTCRLAQSRDSKRRIRQRNAAKKKEAANG